MVSFSFIYWVQGWKIVVQLLWGFLFWNQFKNSEWSLEIVKK
jgi:hypothetical protein